MLSKRIAVVVAMVVAATCLYSADQRPNIVLILTDNQSYFELGCHGHQFVNTPRIDALANQGVDFVNFHAPPYCSPSRGVLMTGRYAMRSGIHDTIGGRSILHKNEVTIAERLKKAGYSTGIFGKWHLGFSYPYLPHQRGFDISFIHGGGGIGHMEDYFGNTHLNAWYWRNGKAEPSQGFSSDVLFNEGLKFIEAHKDRPFFAFISTPATHSPWQAHPEKLEQIKARDATEGPLALYSMIENIDDNVGRVLDRLDALGLSKNTLVIFATDQGMTDRGAETSRVTKQRASDRDAYDERHHAFCMMRYPPLTTRPHQSSALVGMVDMVPTLLDIAGVNQVAGLDGRSLRPLLVGEEKWVDDRELIVQCPRGRKSKKWGNAVVKTQRWRLVGGDRLYDIVADWGETTNVAAQHPEVVSRLTAAYDIFWNSLPSEQDSLSRHIIGIHATQLNGTDWYQGDRPWNASAFKEYQNGKWAVTVERDGIYTVECRHYPREADKAMQASWAKLQIGEMAVEKAVATTATHVTFEIELKAGDYDMQTIMTTDKSPQGALFVYISAN